MSDETKPPEAPAPEPGFLTVEQFAELAQVPRSTAYQEIAAGNVPGVVKIGRHLRVNRAAVLAWGTGEVRGSLRRRKR
jgi:excisionase family DNA binding protein